MKFYTIGYEGSDIQDFVRSLWKQGVRRIIDVRKNPVSRKKGFSKNRLAAALAESKIDYVHLPGLGMPREWRLKAKNKEITRAKMFRDYEKKVLPKEQGEIREVIRLMREKPSALLCFEDDPLDCHRHWVAEEVLRHEKKGTKVIDLHVHPVHEKGRPSVFRDGPSL